MLKNYRKCKSEGKSEFEIKVKIQTISKEKVLKNNFKEEKRRDEIKIIRKHDNKNNGELNRVHIIKDKNKYSEIKYFTERNNLKWKNKD